MYVCICKGITDADIKLCIEDGCTFKEMIKKLNICNTCGNCSKEALKIYKESFLKN